MNIANRWLLYRISMAFILVLAAILSQPSFFSRRARVQAQEQGVQVIEVTAKKYEFSPSPIRVKAGTKVQLKITAVDHDHGFQVTTVAQGADKPGLVFSSPQDCVQLKKGQTTTVEFVAQTPGTYAFKCCHVCGIHHKSMHSEIIVE